MADQYLLDNAGSEDERADTEEDEKTRWQIETLRSGMSTPLVSFTHLKGRARQ